MPSEDRQVESFDGAKLKVQAEGPEGAPAVLLSHAVGGSLAIWDEVAPALAKQFRVLRYDARGHGASDAPAGEYTIEMMAKDALAVLDAYNVGKAHFVGLSMGGMIGMWLAAHAADRIDKLVVANSTAHIPAADMLNGWINTAKASGLDSLAEPIIGGWLSAGFKAAHPEATKAMVETMRTMKVDGFAGAIAVLRDSDRRPDLPLIKAPTLIIAGIEDGPRGEAAAAAMAAGIAGSTRADLPGAAHLSPTENPAAFSQAVLAHLA